MIYIVGLGNPGEEYKNTRHNAGRIVLDIIRKKIDAEAFVHKKILKALLSVGNVEDKKVTLIAPETYMNSSGLSLKTLIKDKEGAANLVVIYDDLDLPIGKMKISFDRGTGGHKGLDSIVNHIKTCEFIRFRIGISEKDENGKTIKPKNVEKFVLEDFSESEMEEINKIGEKIFEALKVFIKEGKGKVMTLFN